MIGSRACGMNRTRKVNFAIVLRESSMRDVPSNDGRGLAAICEAIYSIRETKWLRWFASQP